MNIIQEVIDWRKWQIVAGKNPKQIKLAPHHMRALTKWGESTSTLDSMGSNYKMACTVRQTSRFL